MEGVDLSNVNIANIIKPMFDLLPKDIRLMLEEYKKKHDEDDMSAVLVVRSEADRWGAVTKVKDIVFASTSTDASPKVAPTYDISSSITIDLIQKMLAECDALWLDRMNKKYLNK